MEKTLDKLRHVVDTNVKDHRFSNAAYFADKLVTLSHGDPNDVFTLAWVYYCNKQYRRSLAVLRKYGMLDGKEVTKYSLLAAKSMMEVKELDDALQLLGGDKLESALALSNVGGDFWLLRGKLFDALEIKSNAVHCFKNALMHDVYCYEAFEALVENHMLTVKQEADLIAQLPFGGEDGWLRELYRQKTHFGYHRGVSEDVVMSEDHGESVALKSNLDVTVAKAEALLRENNCKRAYELTKRVLEEDAERENALPVHIASLVELGEKGELYYISHKLVDENPDGAVAWYAVGCYYYLIKSYESARKYFNKATTLDPRMAAAWIGFGHAFAGQDESDQALAAYRTASRLFAGLHYPYLYIGMEYLHTNNLNLASEFFQQAKSICPYDPLVYNELGVVFYSHKNYDRAIDMFQQAIKLSPDGRRTQSEPLFFNLAHTYRKKRMYTEAVKAYEKALTVSPRNASIYAAMGFTFHLMGSTDQAIVYYHKALGISEDDSFTTEMLGLALQDEATLQL